MVDVYKQYMEEYLNGKDFVVLTSVDHEEIRNALTLRVEQAIQKKVDAAFGGSMTDGGCSRILAEIRSYVAGWNRTVPSWLTESIKEHQRQSDPEYADYLRLRKKFE